MREARAAGLPASVLEASAAELADEQRRLREEDRLLDARVALAREQIPAADQVAAICREYSMLHAGAAAADWQTKRRLLEDLEVQVEMRGMGYRITGRVQALERHGTLRVHSACTS